MLALTSRLLHQNPIVPVKVGVRFNEQHKPPHRALSLARAEAEIFECTLTLAKPRASKHPISQVSRDVSEHYVFRVAKSLLKEQGVIIDVGGRNRHGLPRVHAMQPSTLPQDVNKSTKRVTCTHTIQNCDCPFEHHNVAVAVDSSYYFKPDEALPFLKRARVSHFIINQWLFNGNSANLGEANWTHAHGVVHFTLQDTPVPSVYTHEDPWIIAGEPAPLPGYHAHIVKMSATRVVIVYELNDVVSSFAPIKVELPVTPVVELAPTVVTPAAPSVPLVPPPLSLPLPTPPAALSTALMSDPVPVAKANPTCELEWVEYCVKFPKRYRALGFTMFAGTTEIIATLPSQIVNALACSFRTATSSNVSSILGRAQRLFRDYKLEETAHSARIMHLCVAQAMSEADSVTNLLSMGNFGEHNSAANAALSGVSFDKTAVLMEAASLLTEWLDVDARMLISGFVSLCGGSESEDSLPRPPPRDSTPSSPEDDTPSSPPSFDFPPPPPAPALETVAVSQPAPSAPADAWVLPPPPSHYEDVPFPPLIVNDAVVAPQSPFEPADQTCAIIALGLGLCFYANFWLSFYCTTAFVFFRYGSRLKFNVDFRELRYVYISFVYGRFAAALARGCDNLSGTFDGAPTRIRHVYRAVLGRAHAFLGSADPSALLNRFPQLAAAASLAFAHYMPDVRPRDIVARLREGVGKRLRSGDILPPSATDQHEGDRIFPSVSGLAAPDVPSESVVHPRPRPNMVILGPGILPASCPAPCTDNIRVAIEKRIVEGSASTFTEAGKQAMRTSMFVIAERVPYSKHFYTFAEWVAKYPAAKRQLLQTAYAQYLSDGVINYTLSCFLKAEPYFKAEELQKPRVIWSSHPSYVVAVARYLATLADRVSSVYGPSKNLCYYSRMGQAEAGAWMHRFYLLGYRFMEGDATAFDATQKWYIGMTRLRVYELLGLPAHIKAILTKRVSEKKIVFGDGTKMKVVGQTDSGAQDTKFSNDLANSSALFASLFLMLGCTLADLSSAIRDNLDSDRPFFAVMVNGDDNVIAIRPDILDKLNVPLLTSLVASVGYRYNFIDRKDPAQLTFNSALFWPAVLMEELHDGHIGYADAGPTHALLPAPGRVLARLIFSCQDLTDVDVRMRMQEKCRALANFCWGIPVLGRIVTHIASLPMPGKPSIPYEAEYDWPTSLPLQYVTKDMEDFFYARYGTDFTIDTLVKDYLEAYKAGKSLGDHPGFVAMARIDLDV